MYRYISMKLIKVGLLLFIGCCLLSCQKLNTNNYLSSDRLTDLEEIASENSNLAEVAPPEIIKQLNQRLEEYLPQVKIIAPQPKQTYQQTDVEIKLEVEALPIFRDDKLQLGNHLNLIIDNEPLQEIYTTDEPILIENLAPGTHTIRAFAVRPWGESFKNKEAYAQTTFNVLTETNDNRPVSSLPLLTYSSPNRTISAEPLLLDYYLTNASLNAVSLGHGFAYAELKHQSNLFVKATINGTSFTLDDWQPVYLTGLEPGENWVQLELIDEEGNNIENAFNNTVRVFNYNPQQQDILAQLISNKIPLAEAQSIIKQNYYIQPVGTPEIVDFEDSTEPEIVTNIPNNPVESEPKPETQKISPIVEPTTSTSAAINDNQTPNIEITTKKPASAPESLDSKQIVETKADSIPTSLNVDSSASKSDLIIPVPVELEQPVDKIVITEADPNPEKPPTTIDIFEPKSVEIDESEIAIAIPQTQKDGEALPPKSNSPASLWWRKILVGLRRGIETIARKLPDQV